MIMPLMALTSQAEPSVSLAGHWSFTARVQAECVFGGTAYLQPDDETLYSVSLTARQSCPALEQDYIVRQDCQARQFGNQLSVRCQIMEFLNGVESPFYHPDHFSLTIASDARMHGALLSAGNAMPAEWVRSEGGIS